jgi:hypothetical protein
LHAASSYQNPDNTKLLNIDNIKEALRREYPHGFKHFIDLAILNISTHNNKNHDYTKGDTPDANFRRVSSILSLYSLSIHDKRVVAVIYMLKQLDAYLNMLANDYQSVTGEGKCERLADIAVYANILACMELEG